MKYVNDIVSARKVSIRVIVKKKIENYEWLVNWRNTLDVAPSVSHHSSGFLYGQLEGSLLLWFPACKICFSGKENLSC